MFELIIKCNRSNCFGHKSELLFFYLLLYRTTDPSYTNIEGSASEEMSIDVLLLLDVCTSDTFRNQNVCVNFEIFPHVLAANQMVTHRSNHISQTQTHTHTQFDMINVIKKNPHKHCWFLVLQVPKVQQHTAIQ